MAYKAELNGGGGVCWRGQIVSPALAMRVDYRKINTNKYHQPDLARNSFIILLKEMALQSHCEVTLFHSLFHCWTFWDPIHVRQEHYSWALSLACSQLSESWLSTLGQQVLEASSKPITSTCQPCLIMPTNSLTLAMAAPLVDLTLDPLRMPLTSACAVFLQVSQAASDLLAYCEAHVREDPLIIPVPASENPFREKKFFCTIL